MTILRRTASLLLLLFLVLAVACSDDEQTPADNQSTPDAGETEEDTGSDHHHHDIGGGDTHDDTGHHHDDTGDSGGDADCLPSLAGWEEHAQDTVVEYCGACHGETPDFGAPHSLINYDDIIAGTEGSRLVDDMTTMLVDGDMPPAGMPQPSNAELSALVHWTSCGEAHPDHSANLVASAPEWEAPEEAPSGLESFDITAGGYAVADTLDEYRCFAMEVPIDEPQLMRRIEPIIDQSQVLHHFVMSVDRSQSVEPGNFGCPLFPPGDEHIYAWGPGQTALEFDDGGLLLNPADRLVLQIHYNNGAGLQGIEDSSGLRIFHQDLEGSTEYAMAELFTIAINIPPNSTHSATASCTVNQEVELVGTWPHMHEIGSEFAQTVTRSNGDVDDIVSLTGWHFEAQLLYHTPMTLHPGDTLDVTCTWDNPHDYPVTFGTGTEDEMCFSFMYVTPPIPNFCN